MGVHQSGDGASWDGLENLDVDQPHGKDYLQFTHLAKAVRKRIDQEHSTFADSTAGGIHTPGGVAVVGVEYTDDCTATTVADGTYRARGLVWAYSDTSNWGVLFCNTSAAGTSTCGDFTVLKMHPDLQWSGGDVTWAGAHEFDASVDMTGPLWVDGSCDFSDVHVSGDLTVAGAVLVDGSCDFSDVYIEGEASFDGTVDFGDGVAFVAEVSIGGNVAMAGNCDVTGTLSIGSVFSADASGTVTLPGGIILKWGEFTTTNSGANDCTFGSGAFPNNAWQAIPIADASTQGSSGVKVYDICVDGLGIYIDNTTQSPVHYMAVGN